MEARKYDYARQQPPFDSVLLAGLPRLRRLELNQFGLLRLGSLPASLHTLRVCGSFLEDVADEQAPFTLFLPEHCW